MSNELEQRVERLEVQMNDLHRGLFGTAEKPGTFELVRRTNDTVEKMNGTVETLRQDDLKRKGAFWMVGLLCGFIGWLTSILFK